MTLEQYRHRQGIVLMASLALLLAISIGAMGAAQTAMLELRMARNQQDDTIAFHAAETALEEAEDWLQTAAADPPTLFASNGAGLFIGANYGDSEPWRQTGIWQGDASRVFGHAPANAREPPRAVLEWLKSYIDSGSASQPLPPVTIDVFRITARGFGASAEVTLQTTFARARGNAGRNIGGRLSWTVLD